MKDNIPQIGQNSILDVGCGTGDLCISLSSFAKKVIGIDPDLSMLDRAREKAGENNNALYFFPYGMLDIKQYFNNIDAILCFGNTLVHLKDDKEISVFLNQARYVLRPGGKLMIQIINYDRIIDQGIGSLPTIENDQVKFIRNYHYDATNNSLGFETNLTIKGTNEEIHNLIQLYPIRKRELEELLKNAGFDAVSFYGNFKGEALTDNSIPLVLEAIC